MAKGIGFLNPEQVQKAVDVRGKAIKKYCVLLSLPHQSQLLTQEVQPLVGTSILPAL